MRKLQLIIGVAISVLCLYFAFRGISFKEVARALQQADPRWLFASLAVYACGFAVRAVRWRGILQPVKSVSSTALMRPMIIGFFANNILPFRMGEIVRAHVTGQKFDISLTTTLATIVLERICDTLSFLTMFLAVALFFPFPDSVKHGAYGLGIACIVAIAMLLISSKHQHTANRLIEYLPLSAGLRKKLQELVVKFGHGISGMTSAAYVTKALVLSIGVWAIEGTNVFLITRAFPVHISYPQAYFVLFFLGLSVTLPQAPGYVGTVELFGVMAFSLLGIPKELGLPIVLTIHGLQFCFIGLLGCLALWKEGLSLTKLLNRRELST